MNVTFGALIFVAKWAVTSKESLEKGTRNGFLV
jgi:hypothetical protein